MTNIYGIFHYSKIKTGAFHAGRMNSHMNELSIAQSKQEYIEADDRSSQDCSSEKDNNVHSSPAGTVWTRPPPDVSLPGVIPHPHQYVIQAGMVDPCGLRYNGHSFTQQFRDFLTLIICILWKPFLCSLYILLYCCTNLQTICLRKNLVVSHAFTQMYIY